MIAEELELRALKKEVNILRRKKEAAAEKYNEYMGAGNKSLSIHEEFKRILDHRSDWPHEKILGNLEVLQKRRAVVDKIMSQDLTKLTDHLHNSEIDYNGLNSIYTNRKFQYKTKGLFL